MNLDSYVLIELAKSFGRFIYFGLLGLVGTFLTSLLASGSLNNAYVTLAGAHVPVGFLLTAAIGGVLKLVDRAKHLDTTPTNGIAPGFLQR